MVGELFVRWFGTNPVVHGLVGGLVIAALNLLGASLVFVWRDPSDRAMDGALGFAAGVMLAASFTSLVIPGIETYSNGNPVPVLIGLGLGALFLDRSDVLVPHAHYLLSGRRRADAGHPDGALPLDDERLAGVVLFILAITLHNMPEGLAVSVAAINAGLDKRFYAAFAGIRSGVVEIPLAVLGAYAVQSVSVLLPYAMGFAAGAMLFVISDEIVPETHASGHERVATLGTILGIIVMLYLDVSLG